MASFPNWGGGGGRFDGSAEPCAAVPGVKVLSSTGVVGVSVWLLISGVSELFRVEVRLYAQVFIVPERRLAWIVMQVFSELLQYIALKHTKFTSTQADIDHESSTAEEAYKNYRHHIFGNSQQ